MIIFRSNGLNIEQSFLMTYVGDYFQNQSKLFIRVFL